MVSGSSRLVAGVMQLALLAFGIIAGIQAVGVSSLPVFSDSANVLGDWAPWLGVLVFAVGVMVANSAPPRSFPGLLLVLYAAWVGQVLGNAIFGGYVSAFVGALVMTPVAAWVSRLPSAMPAHASFLPGFWLLVPGALGLIGLTQLAGDAGGGGPTTSSRPWSRSSPSPSASCAARFSWRGRRRPVGWSAVSRTHSPVGVGGGAASEHGTGTEPSRDQGGSEPPGPTSTARRALDVQPAASHAAANTADNVR